MAKSKVTEVTEPIESPETVEVVMTNGEAETEVHKDSVAAMEACGWKVK